MSATPINSLSVLVEPTVEPITLAEAKLHLRVDHSDEDALITALITAARVHVERYTRRTLTYTAYRMLLDVFPIDIRLPRSPAVSAAANTVTGIAYATPRIRYYDDDDSLQTLTYAGADFELLLANNPPLLVLPALGDWPTVYTGHRGAVEIDWIAGYGAAASSVPQPLRIAIRMLVAHWYEQREAVAAGTMSEVPLAVQSLMLAYVDGSHD